MQIQFAWSPICIYLCSRQKNSCSLGIDCNMCAPVHVALLWRQQFFDCTWPNTIYTELAPFSGETCRAVFAARYCSGKWLWPLFGWSPFAFWTGILLTSIRHIHGLSNLPSLPHPIVAKSPPYLSAKGSYSDDYHRWSSRHFPFFGFDRHRIYCMWVFEGKRDCFYFYCYDILQLSVYQCIIWKMDAFNARKYSLASPIRPFRRGLGKTMHINSLFGNAF